MSTRTSHMWHKKNSLPYTEVLGKVACIVCSKILGIGSAERCWGDVKKNKTGQRSHLGALATKKQSTLYGAYSAEKATIQREQKKSLGVFWDDDDFKGLGLNRYGIDIVSDVNIVSKKIFRAWLEDWEKDILLDNDPVHEAKFLKKYGGVVWYDIDENENFTASSEKMHFSRMKKEKGYCVYGMKENFTGIMTNINNDDTWEPWALVPDLYSSIIEYYDANPSPNIQIVLQQTS